jgi:hypothetical protein
MATVPPPVRPRNLAEAHEKVRSPLAQLRGTIRTYVSLEGAAVVGLYLAVWFWVGLLLDYGIFRLSTLIDPSLLRPIDWVQILPAWLRAGILGVLTLGLVLVFSLTVFTRLFREFADASLALVLERRFPEKLGDRLITAVELSDPEKAAEYGYSPAMVRETIHQAAEAVQQVPVNEVFNWGRLKVRGIIVAFLILGLYVLVGLGFCTANAVRTGSVGIGGFLDLNEISIVWFQRNILLWDVIWPRRAHLVLVDFPKSGEYHIGRGQPAPDIRVRALRYIVFGAPSAEARARYESWLKERKVSEEESARRLARFGEPPPEGWRALTWFDLDRRLLGDEVPAITFPTSWEPRTEESDLTLDAIALYFEGSSAGSLSKADQEALGATLEKLDQRASERGMSRTLRKLDVPGVVELIYTGLETGNVTSTTLEQRAGNEYIGRFGELKESVRFTVQGEDYSLPPRYIYVEEPPDVEKIWGEEERPAYLYYRLPEGTGPEPLRNKKQKFEALTVSVQGGETSLVTVPAGTNLTMLVQASKPLDSVALVPSKAGIAIEGTPPELDEEGRNFRTTFANVRFKQDFFFQMVDRFGVEGSRHVVVRPLDDQPPRIKEFNPGDLVRKTKEGYLMTVQARIPFVANINDDHGLHQVRYAYTVVRADLAAGSDAGARYLMGLAPWMMPASGSGVLQGVSYLLAGKEVVSRLEKQTEKHVEYYDPPRFREMVETRWMPGEQLPDRLRQEVLALPTVTDLLKQKQVLPFRQLLRDFRLSPDKWTVATDQLQSDFPAWQLGLQVAGERQVQPRYRVEIWLEASDQAVDKVPAGQAGQTSPSAERFVFVLVSETELLAEIAKEEELKYNELKATYDRYLESENKLVQTTLDLSSARVTTENLEPMAVRCNQILEGLERAQRETHDVYVAYERILRELQANRVQEKHIERVEKNIVNPLRTLDEVDFDLARRDLVDFRTALDDTSKEGQDRIDAARMAGDKAKEQLREVKERLFQVLGAMEGLVDVNKLVQTLRELEEEEMEQHRKIQEVYFALIKKIFGADGAEPK